MIVDDHYPLHCPRVDLDSMTISDLAQCMMYAVLSMRNDILKGVDADIQLPLVDWMEQFDLHLEHIVSIDVQELKAEDEEEFTESDDELDSHEYDERS